MIIVIAAVGFSLGAARALWELVESDDTMGPPMYLLVFLFLLLPILVVIFSASVMTWAVTKSMSHRKEEHRDTGRRP